MYTSHSYVFVSCVCVSSCMNERAVSSHHCAVLCNSHECPKPMMAVMRSALITGVILSWMTFCFHSMSIGEILAVCSPLKYQFVGKDLSFYTCLLLPCGCGLRYVGGHKYLHLFSLRLLENCFVYVNMYYAIGAFSITIIAILMA